MLTVARCVLCLNYVERKEGKQRPCKEGKFDSVTAMVQVYVMIKKGKKKKTGFKLGSGSLNPYSGFGSESS